MIESTGVAAIGVHGRTKDERPNNPNHDNYIQEVVKVMV
jgi:tRNA-dihydrouridine synthase 2